MVVRPLAGIQTAIYGLTMHEVLVVVLEFRITALRGFK